MLKTKTCCFLKTCIHKPLLPWVLKDNQVKGARTCSRQKHISSGGLPFPVGVLISCPLRFIILTSAPASPSGALISDHSRWWSSSWSSEIHEDSCSNKNIPTLLHPFAHLTRFSYDLTIFLDHRWRPLRRKCVYHKEQILVFLPGSQTRHHALERWTGYRWGYNACCIVYDNKYF